jgi:hypothetical protein
MDGIMSMTRDQFTALIARMPRSDEPGAPFSDPGTDAIAALDSLIGYARQIRAAGDSPATAAARLTPDSEPDFSDPDDRAVTAAVKFLPGELDSGGPPCIVIGGAQVMAWRQDGTLQVDVNLEDAEPDGTWKLDGNQLTVIVTVAGQAVSSDQYEVQRACDRCGGDNENGCGDGWMGLCASCADQDYARGKRG